MRVGHVIADGDRSFLSRWRWPVALGVLAVTALGFVVLGALKPAVVVYPTTDYLRLPAGATAFSLPTAHMSCASVRQVDGSPKLFDETCGSSASTFRVLGRVGNASQCVRDADLTYKSSSGAVCLDYDWAANQCLRITKGAVSKVDCVERGAVLPDLAIVGAVDVTYCREGGIAHSIRHFTVCTLAGDKNCKGRTRAS